MSYDGVVTNLCNVPPEFQAQVHKEVLAASKEGLNVSVRYEIEEGLFNGYAIFTMTTAEVENYRRTGGQWTYVDAKDFLNNSSAFVYWI